MSYESYVLLKEEIQMIPEIVKHFPEPLQGLLSGRLLEELLGQAPGKAFVKEKSSVKKSVRPEHPEEREIQGIARLSNDNDIELILKDPNAQNKTDAARRLAYVALRVNELLRGMEQASFQEFILPILKKWNVDTNNTRSALSRDSGLARKGDTIKLTEIGREKAQSFIEEISKQQGGLKKQPA